MIKGNVTYLSLCLPFFRNLQFQILHGLINSSLNKGSCRRSVPICILMWFSTEPYLSVACLQEEQCFNKDSDEAWNPLPARMDIARDLKPQLPLPLWGFFSEAVTAPQALPQTPGTAGISSLLCGSLSPHSVAGFGLHAEQFREVSLQIYFILFLLERPSELSFSFSSRGHRICCTICGLWEPLCFIHCILQYIVHCTVFSGI